MRRDRMTVTIKKAYKDWVDSRGRRQGSKKTVFVSLEFGAYPVDTPFGNLLAASREISFGKKKCAKV